jgi:hypothetical protein
MSSDPLPADLAAAHAMILAQREQLTLAKSEVTVGRLEIERLKLMLAKARPVGVENGFWGSSARWSMSQLGQNRKSSMRAKDFRFDLDSGHRPTTAACPKSANSRLMHCSKFWKLLPVRIPSARAVAVSDANRIR